MSGLDVTVTQAEMNNTDGPQAIAKPTVEVVFDVQRPGQGAPLGPDEEDGRAGRIARGLAAMQRAGHTVGKVPAAAAKAPEEPTGEKKSDGGMEVTVVDPSKPDEGGSEVIDRSEKPAEGAEVDPEKPAEAEKKEEPVVAPEVAKYREDLAVAQARIDTLLAGGVSDENRGGWIEKPVDYMRGLVARDLGVAPDSVEAAEALALIQWELTLDGVPVENLPKELLERNNTEQAKRREKLAGTARTATEAAKTQVQSRAAVHKLVSDRLAASADKFPHAAIGADLNLGGVSAAEAAIYLWGEAVKRGEVKNTGNDDIDIPEALRLYNEFSKTRLGNKLQLQNATPSPASAPAASKEAATGASKKTATTVSQKQAASAPAAKQVTNVPAGPEVIDASDSDARARRVSQIASKHLAK